MTAVSVETGSSGSYFPTLPPRAPRASSSYCRSLREAPVTALLGVLVDGKEPDRHPVTRRCRVRNQVGSTNRWRLPESLGSDLLGTAQAVRSINSTLNDSMMQIISAESPQMTMHVDLSEPYAFRHGKSKATPTPSLKSNTPSMEHNQIMTIPRPLSTCLPSTARPAKPLDLFYYHTHKTALKNPTDSGLTVRRPNVILRCLNMTWELHRTFLNKSSTLSSLHRKSTSRQFVDEKPKSAYDKALLDSVDIEFPDKSLEVSPHSTAIIELNVKNPMVNKSAMAIALGHLYHDDIDMAESDVVHVLAAAKCLHFQQLIHGCGQMMSRTINTHTICAYHAAAHKYGLDVIQSQCERWLELNLVPKLCTEIQLRLLPQSVLLKIIQAQRLFTYNEYSVYLVLVYWVFLQMNPRLQLMPSFSSVLTYFNSLPKSNSLLERAEGQQYYSLFANLRLHGITDMSHMKDVQAMNIVPESWIVKVLSQHYHALQAGGDMSLMNNFQTGSLRQGFLMDQEPHYHSEVFSLHGFHFEIKAVRLSNRQTYSFFMQRLKPSDPILSFRHCERHTFSMRPDREVRYDITVQYLDEMKQNHIKSTGMISKQFGLGPKTSRSEVVTLEGMTPPLYVTFSILLPPS